MHIEFSVPSKTFLVGEYGVLLGGPSLLLATNPRFVLRATRQTEEDTRTLAAFHPLSPAGRWLASRWDLFKPWKLAFLDPHQEHGGFGASSAQLLTLMALQHYLLGQTDPSKPAALDAHEIWNTFRQLYNAEQMPPSGADLMTQLAGQVAWFEQEPFYLDTHPWLFTDLEFVLIRTGAKIPTHTHLQNLPKFSVNEPSAIVNQVRHAFEVGDSSSLADGVRAYRHWLQLMKFEAPLTSEIVDGLNHQDCILAAKGCGALGADVVLALIEKENRAQLEKWLSVNKLQFIATSDELTPGLTMDGDEPS